MYTEYYDFPDDTRIDTSPNSSNQKIRALEKVKIDAFVPLQQTISPILDEEGTGTHCIDQNLVQKAPLMSDKKVLSPDWVTELEGETVTCEDVNIKWSTSLPILEGCLTATCYKLENGKSISSVDTGSASIEHGAKTDSDLARPPGGDHPATQQARPGVLTWSAARCWRLAARHAHSSPNDSESGVPRL
jgi:hypothetical protein